MAELYAWMEVEPDGQEGQIVVTLPGLGITGPLQHRLRRMAELMRPIAEKHHRETGNPVRLVRYLRGETIEEIL